MSDLIESESTPDVGPSTWNMGFGAGAKFAIWLSFGFMVLSLVVFGRFVIEDIESPTTSVALVGGCLLLLVVFAVAGRIQLRPRPMTLGEDSLDYTVLWTTGSTQRSMKLSEIEIAVEVAHSFSKTPAMFVIRDTREQDCVVYPRLMSGLNEYEEFKGALESRLKEAGVLARVLSNNEPELERLRQVKKRKFPVTLGFVALLAVATWLQSSWRVGNLEPQWLQLYLLDYGGLWQTSVFDGRWDRLFTAPFLNHHFIEFIFVSLAILVVGHIVERYLGAVQTTIILLTGALAGGLVSLAVLPHAVVVGAWSAGFALLGAAIYLYLRRRPELVVAHQMPNGDTFNVVWLPIFALALSALYVSAFVTLVVLLVTGLCVGAVTTHLLLLSSPSLSGSLSPIKIAIASILAIVFAVGLGTGFWHVYTGEDRQVTRLLWAESAATTADSEDEQARRLHSLDWGRRQTRNQVERGEVIGEFIRHSTLPGWRIAEIVVYNSEDTRCDPEPHEWRSGTSFSQVHHQQMASVLSEEEFDSYLRRVRCICGHVEVDSSDCGEEAK